MNPFSSFVVFGKASEETKGGGSNFTNDNIQIPCSRTTLNDNPGC